MFPPPASCWLIPTADFRSWPPPPRTSGCWSYSNCRTTTAPVWSVTALASPSLTPTWLLPRTGGPASHPQRPRPGSGPVHALPLRLRTQIIGACNLFHTDPHQLALSVTQIGQAMADVATIGLIQERSLRHHETLIDQLQTALNNRIIVEQAKGVLAERRNITPAEAFDVLRAYARRHHHRLTDLAIHVINGTSTATELLKTTSTSPPRNRQELWIGMS
jgi:ANTAR domain